MLESMSVKLFPHEAETTVEVHVINEEISNVPVSILYETENCSQIPMNTLECVYEVALPWPEFTKNELWWSLQGV